MREKFRQFMVGRYGTDGLNQALSIASIVMLLISLLTRISLFTWLGLVLLILCYYRSLSRNISKRTEENYRYYTLKDRVDGKFRGLKDQWANRKLYHYYRCRLLRAMPPYRRAARAAGAVYAELRSHLSGPAAVQPV